MNCTCFTSSLRYACCAGLTLALACGSDGDDLVAPPGREPSDPSGDAAVAAMRTAAIPVAGTAADYDALLRAIGDARVVVLAEAMHGSDEFQRERTRITQRLVLEKGFTAIAVEGGWAETARVDEFIRGRGPSTVDEALATYTGFPSWMMRTGPVRSLALWLREQNAARGSSQQVGIYGLDLLNLAAAADAVIDHLATADPPLAERARAAYACFAPYLADPQGYGAAVAAGTRHCRIEAAEILDALAARAQATTDSPAAREARFAALRNASAVAAAEEFFRELHDPGGRPWAGRERSMSETLKAVERHLAGTTGAPAKVVVWTHTSHVGEVRATRADPAEDLTVAQRTRERLGTASFLVAMHTFTGTVRAAEEWGGPGRVLELEPGLSGSLADLFHRTGVPSFSMVLRGAGAARAELERERLEREVGIVYDPRTERDSHYFFSRLAERFDAAIFLDTTRAVTELQ